MGYKTVKSIQLTSYIRDREGGPIIFLGNYSFVGSGGGVGSPAVSIPEGIISWSSSEDTIVINSTSSDDIGNYTFTVSALDE
jgi:hypothetical protein